MEKILARRPQPPLETFVRSGRIRQVPSNKARIPMIPSREGGKNTIMALETSCPTVETFGLLETS